MKESKESLKAIDNFLNELTEVELETESKTIFTLCEAIREIELYKIEGAILDSFIEWARIESRKHQKRIDELARTTDETVTIDPNQGELIPEKIKILDLSAGNRAIWIQKNLDFVTFLDKRPETSPDFICDTRNIPAEVGDNFDLVVFDPPHLNAGINSNTSKSYGYHTTQEIKETIIGSAGESHRVSKKNALMAFKWNDHDISLDLAIELMSPYWNPLFGHHLRNRGGSASKSQSFWVMFLRRDIPGVEIDMAKIGKDNKRKRTTHLAGGETTTVNVGNIQTYQEHLDGE